MNPVLFNWAPVAVIVGGYLLGIYFQNRSNAHVQKRIDDFRSDMNSRFGEVNNRFADVNSRFNDMIGRISDLKDVVHSEVRRLEEHIDRLDRPVLRP